jgi:pilus assembly protein CpaF
MNCQEELIWPFFRSMGLDRYLLDPEVSELMITNGLVFVERAGQMSEIAGIEIDERKMRAGVEVIGQSIGDQIADYHKPWLDSRLPDGSRVAATYPPISPQGVMVTIRKFLRHFTTEELLERGALTPEVLQLIISAVHARKNVLVSGGTSTGKTTMTNAFVRHIPAHERIVVIEKPVEMNSTIATVRGSKRIPKPEIARRSRCRSFFP